MEGEICNQGDRRILKDPAIGVSNSILSAENNVNDYVCAQTGEEFSAEFLHERLNPRINPTGLPMDQNHEIRSDFLNDHNRQLRYEDLARMLGLSRINSECGSDVSEVVSAKGFPGEIDDWVRTDGMRRCTIDSGDTWCGHREAIGEVNFGQATLGSRIPPVAAPNSPHSCLLYEPGTSDCSHNGKVRMLCSFGGKILPRPSDGKLRYVGGETRLISIQKNFSLADLLNKTTCICNQPHTIKYQLPDEDLDSLISVSSDEDLQNMMEEYHGLGGQRLRIFLIPGNENENQYSPETGAIQQGKPDYEYVVAINSTLDPSPKKNSTEQLVAAEVNKYGDNFDHNPVFPEDSPSSLHWLELKDGTRVSHLTQVSKVVPSSNISPNQSPSFSPNLCLQGNSKGGIRPWNEDKSCQESTEINTSIITAQQPFGHSFGKANLQACRSHFHACQSSREFVPPPVINSNHNKIDGCFITTPMSEGRAIHFKKCMSEVDDRGIMLGSVDSTSSHHGMIHAFSDSHLQQYGEGSAYCSQDGMNPFSPLNFVRPLVAVSAPSQANLEKAQDNIDVSQPEVQNKLLVIESTVPHRKVELLGPVCSESLGCNQLSECSSKTVDEKFHTAEEDKHKSHHAMQNTFDSNPFSLAMMNRVVSPSSHLYQGVLDQNRLPPTAMEYKLQNANFYQFNTDEQEPQVFQGLASEPTASDSEPSAYCFMKGQDEHQMEESNNLFTSLKRAGCQQWDLNTTKIVQDRNNLPQCIYSETSLRPPSTTLLPYRENLDTDPPSGLSSDLNFPVSAKWPSVACQRDGTLQESFLINSTNIYTSTVCNDANSVSDLQQCGISHLSQYSNNDVANGRQNVMKLEDECTNEKSAEDSVLTQSQTLDSAGQNQHESLFVLEEVKEATHDMLTGVNYSSAVMHHVVDVASDELQLPSVTEEYGISTEIVSHDAKAFDGEKGDTINDAVIAEIEAGIYGFQIIKNSDLEELRELGSGTYGTVYHGKWRGTDVAIKRIKKSCFTGRLSEQDRLNKDFWRETQILSKLHHPNVLAFYGVVPDGAGGTLATVTEYMVNGSLRNVLVKKDRSLDHRKKLIIAMDAAFGMEYLHSKNIVHFDLKCDNLLVNLRDPQRPICKVGDFGLSRIKRNTLVSGGVRGTLPWMAPELLNGSSSKVSEKVDVFSFGIAMWEILTGEEPYENMHCGAIIGGILKETLRPPIPEHCDTEWRKLMEQCWSSDPNSRPSFTDIANKLRSLSAALPSRGGPKYQ
ncbi:hypothetical protein Nepgr_032767 [Nepenthes gracilis]|uniref:Protein kinase domain-containing protein n=1 Tax=Nepenthes gracilis TaxID=150966 RepID=A0AAD3TKL5_NEPGR|nr:hypothetical protein Nepgr_032767 [Nepenthes gracilis]